MLLNCGVGEDSWESLGLQGVPTSPSQRKSVLNIHWKDWCWSWNSNTLATWWEELTFWKRPWCWEKLKAGGEGDSRQWDGWVASRTQWTWLWVNSGGLVMDREAWHAAVHGVTKSWTGLSNWTELSWAERLLIKWLTSEKWGTRSKLRWLLLYSSQWGSSTLRDITSQTESLADGLSL